METEWQIITGGRQGSRLLTRKQAGRPGDRSRHGVEQEGPVHCPAPSDTWVDVVKRTEEDRSASILEEDGSMAGVLR